MKVASWNVNSLRVRLPQVLAWLETAQPDILALQETKLEDAQFPRAAFEEAGWQVVFSGQKTYNGVALIARETSSDCLTDIPALADDQRRILAATIGDTRIINLYVPNGQAVDSDKFNYKLDWLGHVRDHIAAEMETSRHLIVLGDFNIAPADADVHDPAQFVDAIHCSAPERAALAGISATGLTDTLRLFDQPARTFSWWDYRANAFKRDLGLRIDLILASDALAACCSESHVDVTPRRNERPSDHAPIVATFDL